MAYKNAQADIFTLGTCDIFQMAKPHLDLSGCIADIYCVSRVSAGLDGLGNEIVCAIKRFLWVQHLSRLGAGNYSVNRAAIKKR